MSTGMMSNGVFPGGDTVPIQFKYMKKNINIFFGHYFVEHERSRDARNHESTVRLLRWEISWTQFPPRSVCKPLILRLYDAAVGDVTDRSTSARGRLTKQN